MKEETNPNERIARSAGKEAADWYLKLGPQSDRTVEDACIQAAKAALCAAQVKQPQPNVEKMREALLIAKTKCQRGRACSYDKEEQNSFANVIDVIDAALLSASPQSGVTVGPSVNQETGLAPCPFCGSSDVAIERLDEGANPPYWNVRIVCRVCYVRTDKYNLKDHDKAMIADWNRRVPFPQPSGDSQPQDGVIQETKGMTRCTTGDNCWIDTEGKHHHIPPTHIQETPTRRELEQVARPFLWKIVDREYRRKDSPHHELLRNKRTENGRIIGDLIIASNDKASLVYISVNHNNDVLSALKQVNLPNESSPSAGNVGPTNETRVDCSDRSNV